MGDFESIVSKDSLSSSSSRSVNETINGSHEFTVKGYSLAKGMGAGKCLPSDIFAVGGYDWAIYFYPDGKNPEDNSTYVSAFIALASEGTDVRALFAVTLVDQSGKEKHKVHSHFERSLEGGPYTLKYRGSMWGYKRFFKRAALETSDYLKDDTLIMRCTVGVVRTRLEGPKRYSIPVPPSDMGKGFSELLNTEVACDVTFFCGVKSYKAHKLVLAARSSVFRAQFFCPNAEPDSDRVEVNNIEASIFKSILHFIYTDELPDMSVIEEEVSSWNSIKIVQELLKACDVYKLDRLKLLCESKLCEELSPETVAVMLALAEQHKFVQLKAICLKFAASPGNLGAVMQSEGFKILEEEYPALLCELLKAFASGDEASSTQSGRKRSGSSIYGLDIAADGAAESINPPSTRRVRRRL